MENFDRAATTGYIGKETYVSVEGIDSLNLTDEVLSGYKDRLDSADKDASLGGKLTVAFGVAAAVGFGAFKVFLPDVQYPSDGYEAARILSGFGSTGLMFGAFVSAVIGINASKQRSYVGAELHNRVVKESPGVDPVPK